MLCWAPANAPAPVFEVGLLRMFGPVPVRTALVCTLGLRCAVTVQGRGLRATDRVVVLPDVDGSGDPTDCGAADWQPSSELRTVNVSAGTEEQTHDLGTALAGAPGTAYKLCWFAHDATQPREEIPDPDWSEGGGYIGGPGDPAQPKVELSRSVELHGPHQTVTNEDGNTTRVSAAQFPCLVGYPCSLTLLGVGLRPSNKVALMNGSDCGDPDGVLANFSISVDGSLNEYWEGNPLGPTSLTKPSGSGYGYGEIVFSYGYGEGVPALQVRDFLLCWGHEPVAMADYNVRVGMFLMAGRPKDPSGTEEPTEEPSGSAGPRKPAVYILVNNQDIMVTWGMFVGLTVIIAAALGTAVRISYREYDPRDDDSEDELAKGDFVIVRGSPRLH